MAVHTSRIWKFIVLVKLRHLSDATRRIRMAAQTFCTSCQVVWDLRRSRSRQGCLCRRDRRLVAREARIVRQPDVIGGIGSDDALASMTDLTIGRAANRVRDFFRRRAGLWPRRHGRRENLGECRRVESCKRPLGSVARAIRTKRRIILATGVPRIVTLLARRIKSRTMLGKPCGRAVRFRFIGARHRNYGCRAARARDLWKCVTDVALEPNCLFVVYSKMFAIVTTEAARGILMADVVRMRRPADVLRWKHKFRVGFLEISDSVFDLRGIFPIIVRVLLTIIQIQTFDRLIRLVERSIFAAQDLDCLFVNEGNG